MKSGPSQASGSGSGSAAAGPSSASGSQFPGSGNVIGSTPSAVAASGFGGAAQGGAPRAPVGAQDAARAGKVQEDDVQTVSESYGSFDQADNSAHGTRGGATAGHLATRGGRRECGLRGVDAVRRRWRWGSVAIGLRTTLYPGFGRHQSRTKAVMTCNLWIYSAVRRIARTWFENCCMRCMLIALVRASNHSRVDALRQYSRWSTNLDFGRDLIATRAAAASSALFDICL